MIWFIFWGIPKMISLGWSLGFRLAFSFTVFYLVDQFFNFLKRRYNAWKVKK
jgi:hypothetical protein